MPWSRTVGMYARVLAVGVRVPLRDLTTHATPGPRDAEITPALSCLVPRPHRPDLVALQRGAPERVEILRHRHGPGDGVPDAVDHQGAMPVLVELDVVGELKQALPEVEAGRGVPLNVPVRCRPGRHCGPLLVEAVPRGWV